MTASAQNVLETQHRFFYDTKEPITASMLAESLMGLEGVIKKSAEIVSRLLDVSVKDADVLITAITFGSYDESIWVRLFFGKGRAGEKAIEKLRAQLGLKNMDLKKVVGIAIMLAVMYVAYSFVTKEDKAAAVHIENSFNNWGKELALSKEELLTVLDKAIKNKEELKKQVVKLTHPDGEHKGGAITLDNDASLTIPSSVTDLIPQTYAKDEAPDPFKDFNNVTLVIRAVDLDRPSAGWAAIVPEASDKRLPVELADDVDPMKVPVGKNTQCDITVIYKVDKSGNKTPKRYLLRKVL